MASTIRTARRQRFWRRRASRTAAAGLAGAMLLAACAPQDEAAEDVTEEPDESAADEAEEEPETAEEVADDPWEDVDPIEIRVQGIYGPDNTLSTPLTAYGEAVEEASNGKITFDYYWAGALAPATELNDAIGTGLVDFALHVPIYTPAQFPTMTFASQFAFLETGDAVAGTLQGASAYMEWAFDDDHLQEYEDAGIKPLVPALLLAKDFHLLCADEPVNSLDDAQGLRTRAAGPTYTAEAEALGMTPVDLVVSEGYEAFQRGVVDCAIASISDVNEQGWFEVADHWMLDSEVGFAGFSSGLVSLSLETWEELPLIAQQTLWDNLDVWLLEQYELVMESNTTAIQAAIDAGVEIHEYDDDLREELAGHQESVLASAREGVGTDLPEDVAAGHIDRLTEAHERWYGIVTDELGYEDEDASWADFVERNPDGDVDFGPWVDRVYEELFAPHRPE